MSGENDDGSEGAQNPRAESDDEALRQHTQADRHERCRGQPARTDGGFNEVSPWKTIPGDVSLQRDVLLVLIDKPISAETIRSRLAFRYRVFVTDKQFYPALDDLQERALIRREQGDDEEMYVLTEVGRQAVRDHLDWVTAAVEGTLAEKASLSPENVNPTSVTDDPEIENPGLDAFININSSKGTQGGTDDE